MTFDQITITIPPSSKDKTMKNETGKIDPFDPASLRAEPSKGADLGVKKALLYVPVRKPSRQEFVRVRAETEFRMPINILELKEERETYAVMPAVAAVLPSETRIVELRVCISRTGTLFLWPVPLPTPDGRENAWHKTARDAAGIAEEQWVRIVANMGAGCYDVHTAPLELPEPDWPDVDFPDLLRKAFGAGRMINTLDHAVIQRLQGK
jgi:hypothetical protein